MGVDLRAVKTKVERLTCQIHHRHPLVTVNGTKLNYKCCCEEFRTMCLEESKSALAEEAKRAITESFKNAFKGFK